MREAVVDASVAVKWVLEEPLATQAVRAQLTYELIAPSLLHAEVASALAKSVARGHLTPDVAARKMGQIVHTDIETVPDELLCVGALDLACAIGHSVYDCFYLYLAAAERVPLITADRKLAEAAESVPGVSVIRLEEVG